MTGLRFVVAFFAFVLALAISVAGALPCLYFSYPAAVASGNWLFVAIDLGKAAFLMLVLLVFHQWYMRAGVVFLYSGLLIISLLNVHANVEKAQVSIDNRSLQVVRTNEALEKAIYRELEVDRKWVTANIKKKGNDDYRLRTDRITENEKKLSDIPATSSVSLGTTMPSWFDFNLTLAVLIESLSAFISVATEVALSSFLFWLRQRQHTELQRSTHARQRSSTQHVTNPANTGVADDEAVEVPRTNKVEDLSPIDEVSRQLAETQLKLGEAHWQHGDHQAMLGVVMGYGEDGALMTLDEWGKQLTPHVSHEKARRLLRDLMTRGLVHVHPSRKGTYVRHVTVS